LHKIKKVIHRDIKPSNILLNTGGHVKIADFGVSGTITNTIDCMTSWVGTVTYMSPERIQGESYFSDTDLWSLGIMLLECSMGRFPYPSPQDDIKELGFWELMQYITLKPSPTIPDGEGYSAEFKDFISILLRKKGGSRSTAIELLLHPWMKSFEEVDKKHLRRWLRSLNEKAE
jgi:mitogen-activated protein kinase kinase 1